MSTGVQDRPILETPIAVLDLETTGLTAGADRVVEVSVVRMEPGKQPFLVLDTLVNPRRPMAATEIHGITDTDVADAPDFPQIVGDLVSAIAGCVVAAYNVYFDMRFLEFELGRVGVQDSPPHICLMYLRPMLGLGCRCSLDDACRCHGIRYPGTHLAADDAMAAARLMDVYFDSIRQRGLRTFSDLASLKDYKFVSSFGLQPLSACSPSLPDSRRCHKPRRMRAATTGPAAMDVEATPVQTARTPVAVYWEALKSALTDLHITDGEIEDLVRKERDLGVRPEQVRMLHARAFMGVISQFVGDQFLDPGEQRMLKRLYQCLSRLGWAPGE